MYMYICIYVNTHHHTEEHEELYQSNVIVDVRFLIVAKVEMVVWLEKGSSLSA